MTIIVITKDYIATDGLSTSTNRILASNMDKFAIMEDGSLALFCGSLSDSLALLHNTHHYNRGRRDSIRELDGQLDCGIIRVCTDGHVGEAMFTKKDGYITSYHSLAGEVVLGSGRDIARSYMELNSDQDDSKGDRTLGAVKHACRMITSCGGSLSLISRKTIISSEDDDAKGWLVHDFHPDGTESSRIICHDGSKKRVLNTFRCTEKELNTIPGVEEIQHIADQWWNELNGVVVDEVVELVESLDDVKLDPDFLDGNWTGSSISLSHALINTFTDINIDLFAKRLGVSSDLLRRYVDAFMKIKVCDVEEFTSIYESEKFWDFMTAVKIAYLNPLSLDRPYLTQLWNNTLVNEFNGDLLIKAYHNEMSFEYGSDTPDLGNLIYQPEPETNSHVAEGCNPISKVSIGSCNAFNIWFDKSIHNQSDAEVTKIPEHLQSTGAFTNDTIHRYVIERVKNLKPALSAISNTTIYKSPRFWSLVEYVVINEIQMINRVCMKRIHSTNGATKDIINLLNFELSVMGLHLDVDMNTIVEQVSLIGKGKDAIYADELFTSLTNKQYRLNQLTENQDPIHHMVEVQILHKEIDAIITELCDKYLRSPEEIKELI